ncbi:MAG: hypothetical protein GY858_09895 [Candidatus Omnitrophica bacterium]|nr:hypothetical protein [Candidatus Omnitrophota bacterium]
MLNGKLAEEDNNDPTFKTALEEYFNGHILPNCTERTKKDIFPRLTFHAGHLFSRRLSTFTTLDFQELHSKISQRGNYIANRVLGDFRAVYNHAIKKGYPGSNPCLVKKHYEEVREGVLNEVELRSFYESVAKEGHHVKDYVMTCLHTGAKRGSVLSMKWEDVDLKLEIWNKKTPLAKKVIRILKRLEKQAKNEYVFPGEKLKNSTWTRILKRANLKNVRFSDLRRTLAAKKAVEAVANKLECLKNKLKDGFSIKNKEIKKLERGLE